MKETNMDDFAALRVAIKTRGWYQKTPGRVICELVCHLILTCGGMALFLTCTNPVVRAVAMLVSTVGSVGVGTNTHTSSHYATSNKRWANELLTYFGYPLFLQLSATYWWHKHVVVHTLGWSEAIWKSCLVLRRPKTVEPCLEAFRLRPQRF